MIFTRKGTALPSQRVPGMDKIEALPQKIRRTLIDVRETQGSSLFHKLALIPSWLDRAGGGRAVLGFYGPERLQDFGAHTYLALFLAWRRGHVFIISYAYSRIIDISPRAGEGILSPRKLWGKIWGGLGSALLSITLLTITVSIVSCGDAIFSFFPASFQHSRSLRAGGHPSPVCS